MMTSLRFFTGDENGFLKSVICTLNTNDLKTGEEIQVDSTTVNEETPFGSVVQRMALSSELGISKKLIAAACGNGETSIYSVGTNNPMELVHRFTEPTFRSDHEFIGLGVSSKSVYTCTSRGHLRCTPLPQEGVLSASPGHASLPTRLTDLRHTPDFSHFSYGGNEVELSVWDSDRALTTSSEAKQESGGIKRKKAKQADLLPGEVWRAKNVANDMLNLRQPVHITSLAFLNQSTSPQHHIITGSQSGVVRRYDTRTSRRPVANWEGIGRLGGVKHVQCGLSEHQVFVSDNGCNIFALDTRNGRTLYNYKGIAGAVSCLAPAPQFLASVSLDRFFRLHSAPDPPQTVGGPQMARGTILTKAFLKSTPTQILWDGEEASARPPLEDGEDDLVDEDLWEGMEATNDNEGEDTEEDGDSPTQKRKKKRL